LKTLQNTPKLAKARTKFIAWLCITASVLAAVSITVWFAIGGQRAFTPQTLEDLLASSTELNPVQKSNEMCAEISCIEAWTTNIGSFLRFRSASEAEYWAIVLGDGVIRNEDLVLDIRSLELTFEERRAAIDLLFARRDWF
jgi:hypothetical protein